METNRIEYLDALSRKALRFFGFCAVAIYTLALVYCYAEDRFFETRVVAVATGGVILLILFTYFSIGREPEIDHYIDERPLEHRQKEVYHID